jgi:hypothetical protein
MLTRKNFKIVINNLSPIPNKKYSFEIRASVPLEEESLVHHQGEYNHKWGTLDIQR